MKKVIDLKQIKKMNIGKLIIDPDMKKYTTYRIGGKARAIIYPNSEAKLIELMHYLKENNITYKVIGNGSNLIFHDKGYEGVIIKLSKFDQLEIDNNTIYVGAGYNLAKLALKTAKMSLTGLEFASGIPGSIGGAIFMNAGAYASDMGYVVKNVRVLTPDLEIQTFNNREMNFHYRTSFLKEHPEYICLSVNLKLRRGTKSLIMELIEERRKRRIETQPLSYPSAGSVFRNPEGMKAGKLIEDLGYKGKKIGGAMVSPLHANFIVNCGGATCNDVKELIESIKKEVKKVYHVDLKEEQEFVE